MWPERDITSPDGHIYFCSGTFIVALWSSGRYCSRMTTAQNTERAVIDRIRFHRDRLGSTNAHLISAAGIGRSTFNRYMSGEGSFTVRQLILIAEALGVTLHDLTGDSATSAVAA